MNIPKEIDEVLKRVPVETRRPELIDMVFQLECELLTIAEKYPYKYLAVPDAELDRYKDKLHWGIGVCNSKLRK
jgi:hypothetical protein